MLDVEPGIENSLWTSHRNGHHAKCRDLPGPLSGLASGSVVLLGSRAQLEPLKESFALWHQDAYPATSEKW